MSEIILNFDSNEENDGMYDKIYKELFKKRILYLNGEINETLIDYVAVPILVKNIEESDIPTEKLKPITIWLNSPGGDIDPTLYLIGVIQNSRIPIDVKVLSMAASGGLYITLACRHRTASKNSIFLLHKGSYSLGGNANEVEDVLDFYKGIVDDKIVDLILEKTKLTKEQLSKIRRNETYCLADKALEYGFIDEIID